MAPTGWVKDVPMRETEWPRLAPCQDCRREVLLARDAGDQVVALEPIPVLVGQRRCSHCHGFGCPDCTGTGTRGEELTSDHVVMTAAGAVRDEPIMFASWDSAYRRHSC